MVELVSPFSTLRAWNGPGGGDGDPLGIAIAPVLAGFALAAVVLIGTAQFGKGHPLHASAAACFAAGPVCLVLSMEMLDSDAAAKCRASPNQSFMRLVCFLFSLAWDCSSGRFMRLHPPWQESSWRLQQQALPRFDRRFDQSRPEREPQAGLQAIAWPPRWMTLVVAWFIGNVPFPLKQLHSVKRSL